MIEQIVIENFKSLRKVGLTLGRLNLFIGTNSSGKSNFFDSLRVLRGIAGGFAVKEIFEGGDRTLSGEALPGLRGGLANAIYQPSGAAVDGRLEARIRVRLHTTLGEADYEVAFNNSGAITRESLRKAGKEIFFFDGLDAYFRISDKMLVPCFPNPFVGSQVILGHQDGKAGMHKDFIEAWRQELRSMQFLDPSPEVLRRYGSAADISRMGERGENFASLVRYLCADRKKKESYLSWLRELRPREVEDVTTLKGAVGEPLFALKESGREFPSPVLSDGTLRFAAIAAAFFQSNLPGVLTIEEIENGIHASRLRLLIELLRTHANIGKTQVLATTHSPSALAWLKPDEYAATFLCTRDEATGESHIRPLTELPHFNEVVKHQPIGELFAEGWLEAAI